MMVKEFRIFTIMKSYLLDNHRAVGLTGDSVFHRMKSIYPVHRTGGDSFSIIIIDDFQ
jgi:hypothetical protein